MGPDELFKLSVKELRRQAALRSVPLTHIGAALEKKDLVALILKAPPVLDHYNVGAGKVHSAESIAADAKNPQLKRNRGKKRAKSSSDSSDSSRSRSRRRKRRAKRSRSRKRGRRSRSRKRKGRSRSRSASVTVLTPALPPIRSEPVVRVLAPRTMPIPHPAITGIIEIDDAVPDVPPAPEPVTVEPPKPVKPTVAQAGMAAAAALGFDVMPKFPQVPVAPSVGLRPTVNAAGAAPFGAACMGRVCIEYLCKSTCTLGSKCPEAHIVDPEEEMRVRARFKEQECHYGAACTRSQCLYRHPGEKLEESNFVPEGQQVTLKVTPTGMSLDFM